MADDVVINIRTRGGRQAAAEAGVAATGIRGIGKAAEAAGRGLDTIGRKIISTPLGFLANQARYAAYGLEALGAGAVVMGLRFNATMEQNQVAFTHFLGTEAEARKELALLYEVAAKTPFQFSQVTAATRKFLAFGFSVRESNRWLTVAGDAIAGAGLGAEAIDRMVLALGQIKSKGRLQNQDLRQLQELGVLDFSELAKNLGVTKKELADVGKLHISAEKGLPAIQETLSKSFKGAAAEQAKTFTGQISTLRDYTSQTLGAITFPAFDKLRRDVFPDLTRSAQTIGEIFNRKDLSFAEKLDLSRSVLKRNLGPTIREIRNELGDMELGDKLGDAFEKAAPQILTALGRAGAKGAEAFIKGWWHAGIYGKLFGAALLTSKLGGFAALGRVAAGRFRTSWARNVGTLGARAAVTGAAEGVAAGAAGSAAAGAAGGAAAGGGGGWLSKLGRKALKIGGKAAKFTGAGAVIAIGVDALTSPDSAGLSPGEERARVRGATARQRRARVHAPGTAGRAPSIRVYVGSREVAHVLAVDPDARRELKRSIDRATSDAAARR